MSAPTLAKDGKPVATIYHNPRCGTSRTTLCLIRAAGIEPAIVEYLKHPPGRVGLIGLMTAAGLSAREIVRAKETLFGELGLEAASDKAIIDAMVDHPILMNRPIVVTANGTRLCRPAELVAALLP